MQALVAAEDDKRANQYKEILNESYSFLLSDPEFHLDKVTGGQVAEKFRGQDISGSTVTKSIGFFLALASAAGVKVSAHVKPPPAPRGNGKRGAKKKAAAATQDDLDEEEEKEFDEDVERFEIPIPGKASVRVIVPSDLDADDWEMLQSMITVYIKRWKGFKTDKAKGGPD